MIRLALLGDVMLGRCVDAHLEREPPAFPWGDTLPALGRADLRICNLECALSDRGSPWRDPPKAYHFRGAARNVEVLRAARIDAVSLANNHVLDYDFDAFEDTLAILDRAGIAHAGAGRDLAEAAREVGIQAGGLRVGLLAFTDNEPGWAATAARPGVHFAEADPATPSARALLARVERAARAFDALVVSAHWGPNWGDAPPREHVALAGALIGAGARVVYGHSPHVFRAVEPLGTGVVLYSTGDFVDDYAVDGRERNDWAGIFQVELDRAAVRGVSVIPTVIRGCRAGLATGEERDAIARKMSRLCAARGTRPEWRPGEGALRVLSL